eukprot:768701-Hanusia_phi.AAC.7
MENMNRRLSFSPRQSGRVLETICQRRMPWMTRGRNGWRRERGIGGIGGIGGGRIGGGGEGGDETEKYE